MKTLIVGDVHAKPGDLDDCKRLANLILDVVEDKKPGAVVFLGDQYDTHGIIHVSVQKFWLDFFNQIEERVDLEAIVALVGNHDMLGDRSIEAHAMQAHNNIWVPEWYFNKMGADFVSYTGNEKAYTHLQEVGELGEGLLFCHETFLGAAYDNGFYAKDGIDPAKLDAKGIISGHIHTPMQVGKVWYPGSPRYLTVSDANQSRAIYLMDDLTVDAKIETIPTDKVVSKIWSFKDSPETIEETEEGVGQVSPIDRVVIDITGPASFIEERKKRLARPGVRLRTFPTDGRTSTVRESEGIDVAFGKYIQSFKPKYGTQTVRLEELVKERV